MANVCNGAAAQSIACAVGSSCCSPAILTQDPYGKAASNPNTMKIVKYMATPATATATMASTN